MIFVDTGVWFARFVADDPDHGRVAAWFAANAEQLVTTDYCVDETLTLLAARKRPKLAACCLKNLSPGCNFSTRRRSTEPGSCSSSGLHLAGVLLIARARSQSTI
ncbi:MAG: type II toxin-antitoxin system VapC family toxin [Pirellulales bacterium]